MKKIIVLCLLVCIVNIVNAQTGIGTVTPNATSALEIQSTTKGLLIPRMTSAQRDAIVSPTAGLSIYNTTTNCLNYFIGPNWFESCGAADAALGSTFTSFSNGAPSNENFSDNDSCQNKLISAGHTARTCSGSLTVGANTYNMVLINGQCWMQSDLKEVSTAPCAAPINTGCNVWLNTDIRVSNDIDNWGYFNTTTPNGSAGWGTSEATPGEGLLYQWSAAMNGDTAERAQGACPKGWHIPSDCEWMFLEHGLGMSIASQKGIAWRSTTGEGAKLSMFTLNGNNSSGFSALLTGSRQTTGFFFGRNTHRYFWTSTFDSQTNFATNRHVINILSGILRSTTHSKINLSSVRCLKD